MFVKVKIRAYNAAQWPYMTNWMLCSRPCFSFYFSSTSLETTSLLSHIWYTSGDLMGNSKADNDNIFVALQRGCGHDMRDSSNAITQMIFLVKPLRDYFMDHINFGEQHCEWGRLFQEMVKKPSQSMCTQVVLNPASSVFDAQVEELVQEQADQDERLFEDAWEKLTRRLGKAQQEAHRPIEPPAKLLFGSAEEAWHFYRIYRDNTALADLLLLQWSINLGYMDCSHKHTQWEHKYYLSFEAKPYDGKSLADCIRDFQTEDVVTECENCPNCISPLLQPCARKFTLTHFPPYLLIHLNRFDGEFNKIKCLVNVDIRIQLAKTQYYQLHSAILHKGSADRGCYSTLVREGNDKWTLIMDETAFRQLSNWLAEMMLANFAYILMYEAVSKEEPQDGNAQAEMQAKLKKATTDGSFSVPTDGKHQEQHVRRGLFKHPYCGLVNHRMVCYSNSILQALYTCTRVRKYLLENGKRGEFHHHLAELFTSMAAKSDLKCDVWTPLVNPYPIFNEHFCKKRADFKVNMMHDAQEFLTILMELVHEEANAAKANRERRPKEVPDFCDAASQWAFQRDFVDDSELASLLMGQVESTLTCLMCEHQSRSWTAIWQLQLQLQTEVSGSKAKGPLTLSDCLNEFTDCETLKDDSAPTCSRCRTRQPCLKQQQICRVPPYLVIHLKRFLATGKKIDREVIIEPSLSLCGQQLELCSVICHKGSESIGHYYTMVREGEHHWALLDDDAIRGPLADEAANEKLRSFAYICIYEVIDGK